MSRSKKDGRKGGAHRMGTRSKWHEAQLVRAARHERRRSKDTIEEEVSMIERDIYQDYLDMMAEQELSGEDFDWHEDYLDWQEFDEDINRYQWEDNFVESHWWDDPPVEPEPQIDVFLAVDRAVRRHGIEYVTHHAALLAAALGCSSWEIQRAANLTRQGYIKAYG